MTRAIADALSACHDNLFGKITDSHDNLMSKLATKHEMELGFARLDKKIDYKILTMTISLGGVVIGSISVLGTILMWIK